MGKFVWRWISRSLEEEGGEGVGGWGGDGDRGQTIPRIILHPGTQVHICGNSTKTKAEGIQRYSSFHDIMLLHVNKKKFIQRVRANFDPLHSCPQTLTKTIHSKPEQQKPESSIHKHISLSCGWGRKGQVLRNKAAAFIPLPRVHP